MKVPIEAPQTSLNVPGVSMPTEREFGRVGAAIENVGLTVEDASLTLGQQLTHLQAVDSSSNAFAQNQIDAQTKLAQIKLMSPDGFMHEDPNTGQPSSDSSHPKVKNDDGSFRTMADEFHSWADENYKSAQEAMPSGVASEMYRQRALPYFSGQVSSLIDEVHAKQVSSLDQNQELQVKNYGELLANDPRPESLYDFHKNLAETQRQSNGLMGPDGKGGVHTDLESTQLLNKYGQVMSRELMRGIENNIQLGKKTNGDKSTQTQAIFSALDLINGRDKLSQFRDSNGMPTVSKMMDPLQKELEEKRLIAMLPLAKAQDDKNLNAQFEEVLSATKMGEMHDSPLFHGMITQLMQRGIQHPEHSADSVLKVAKLVAADQFAFIDSASTYRMALPQINSLHNQAGQNTRQVVQEMASQLKLPYAGAMGSTVENEIEASRIQNINKIMGERKEDLAAFAMMPRTEFRGQSVLATGARASTINYSNPAQGVLNGGPKAYQDFSRQYHTSMSTAWADHPENNREAITKPQSQTVSNMIMQTGTEEQAAANVKNLAQIWGKDFEKNISQIIKDKNGLPYSAEMLKLHAHDNSTYATQMIMGAIRGNKVAEEAFRNRPDVMNGTISEKEFNQYLAETVQPFVHSTALSHPEEVDPTKIANNIQEGVGYAAKLIMSRNEGHDFKGAIDTAYKTMVGDHVYSGKVGAGTLWNSAPNTEIMIPKNWVSGQQENDLVRKNLANEISRENLDKLKVFVPTKAGGQPSDLPEFRKKYLDNVSRGNPYPSSTTSPERGYNIWYNSTTGQRQMLMETPTKPVFIPHEQMRIPPPPSTMDKAMSAVGDGVSKGASAVGQGAAAVGHQVQKLQKYMPDIAPPSRGKIER